MNQRIYELAKNKTPDGLEFLGVDFTPDTVGDAFLVWQGVGYHTHATRVSPKAALESWREHLRLSGAEWLVPLLVRFAAAGSIDAQSVLATYSTHHGHDAPHRDANDA